MQETLFARCVDYIQTLVPRTTEFTGLSLFALAFLLLMLFFVVVRNLYFARGSFEWIRRCVAFVWLVAEVDLFKGTDGDCESGESI